MNRIAHLLSIALVLAVAFIVLPGCASFGAVNAKVAADIEKVVEPVRQTTLADAQAALAIAQTHGDQDGTQCFTDIVNYLQNPASVPPAIAGLLSGLEAARTFKGVTIPDNIHRDCAVLVLDAQQAAIRLGLTAAPVVGGVKVEAGAAALKGEAALLKTAEAAAKP